MPARPATFAVLHAHPDDEAIFTGATIARLSRAGARVVLITATGGEEGEPRVPLRAGESMRQRRLTELERACELLGVARLVPLEYRDSGAHAGPFGADSLGAAAVSEVAAAVARVVAEEDATALVHYDAGGIYGHVDHVQVHRVGTEVVAGLGITGYEATVDGSRLAVGPRHVLHAAAGSAHGLGVDPAAISTAVHADVPALLAKMAAMSAHASQIGPEFLDPGDFAAGYGTEWFVRRGPATALDALDAPTNRAAAVRVPVPA